MYSTCEEASNRLLRTIITYGGDPVFVAGIAGVDGAVTLQLFRFPFDGRDGVLTVPVNDPALNGFRPAKLGFMNYFSRGRNNVSWCVRSPARRMQQGLNEGNFQARTLIDGYRWSLEAVRSSDAFNEMIRGEYPDLNTVLEMLVPNSSLAIDRRYAVAMNGEGYKTVYYGEDPLGLLLGGVLYLREDRLYAREQLMECGLFGNNIQNL